MRTALLFPPSLCLPNQLYTALPMLAGALRAAGHEVRCVDLNLAAADRLLTRANAEHYLGMAREAVIEQSARRTGAETAQVRAALEASEPVVLDGEFSKQVLRDPVRCYDQPLFRRAFWNVTDALGFLYQLDPVISPFRTSFVPDMLDNQRRDSWTPMLDLYASGLVDEAVGNDPDFVGLTLAFPEQSAETLRLARKLRERRPGVHIALGGPLLNVHTERWLEAGWIFEFVDSLVIGDGETAIVELLEALEGRRGMESVRNLVWRDAAGSVRHNSPQPYLEDLDDLPLPDFRSVDMSRGFTPRPIYPLMLSRGCYWGRCSFCSIGWRENYRMASPERIHAMTVDLARTYGARYVQMQDSSVPPRGAQLLAQTIEQERLELYWDGGMKFTPQFLDREWCAALQRGGCRSLLAGFESANQHVLDAMDKGFELERVPTMLRNLREVGISVELLWFIGFPNESKLDTLRTVRWLHEHRELFGLTAFVGDYQLHPDTDVFEHPERYGVTIVEHDDFTCRYVSTRGIPQDVLAALKAPLESNNNRTLVCNGSHLPHLVESGLDLSGLERPVTVPVEFLALCGVEPAGAPGRD